MYRIPRHCLRCLCVSWSRYTNCMQCIIPWHCFRTNTMKRWIQTETLEGKTTVSDRYQKHTYLFPFHAKSGRVTVRVVGRFRSLSRLNTSSVISHHTLWFSVIFQWLGLCSICCAMFITDFQHQYLCDSTELTWPYIYLFVRWYKLKTENSE